MKATLTELREDAERVLGAVVQGKETVELTQHGETVAEIHPTPRAMTGAEFARIWSQRKPLGRDVAREVAEALKAIDQAE